DIFDPREPLDSPAAHLTLPNSTSTNLFCSAQLVLPTGELMITGGDQVVNGKAMSRGVPDVNLFNPGSNQLRPAGTFMQRGRWYGTATSMPNGDVYIQGGTDGEDHPEIRGSDGVFRLLTG